MTPPDTAVALQSRFATELPELGIPWQAAECPEPRLLVLNEPLARELGLDPAWLRTPDGVEFLTGRLVPEGAAPVAQAYAGHQFGVPVPRLGDGRALLLGEVAAADGTLQDVHLKGSGPTPFSRGGDGWAAVGPMLREFLVSEAMHALGIPTTRSLAVVATGRTVYREEGPLPGALLVRVAASHLRVGTVQYARALPQEDVLPRLVEHAIARHHPEAAADANPPLALLRSVVAAQARLVAQWLLVGFVHGVMNTDNMTLSGETIDYGPCAFVDGFDRAAVFSSIDTSGRYAYGHQPAIAQWDLARLAEALLPVLHEDPNEAVALATEAVEGFARAFGTAYTDGIRRKLGLAGDVPAETVGPLADELVTLMHREHLDHTGLFRRLGRAAAGDAGPARAVVTDRPTFDDWLARWLALGPDPAVMDATNPVYIPRNHLVEEALAAAQADDVGPLERLLDAVTRPYAERPGLERYAEGPPEDFGRYRTFCGT